MKKYKIRDKKSTVLSDRICKPTLITYTCKRAFLYRIYLPIYF